MSRLTGRQLQEIADRVGYKRILILDTGGYAGVLIEPSDHESGSGVHIEDDAGLVKELLALPRTPSTAGARHE